MNNIFFSQNWSSMADNKNYVLFSAMKRSEDWMTHPDEGGVYQFLI